MRKLLFSLLISITAGMLPAMVAAAEDGDDSLHGNRERPGIQLGDRPFFLLDDMTDSPLKQQLQACTKRPNFSRTDFSIGDASDPRAKTVAEFLGGTANWCTDLYSGPTSGTLMTHKESIEHFKQLGVKMTPELESLTVTMPFDGFTQQAYAQKMIDEYKQAGVSPRRVWAQSFDKADLLHWIASEPAFGKQAVYLDDAATVANLPNAAALVGYKAQGTNIVAPPIFVLLKTDGSGNIVPSRYAMDAKAAGLDSITWTLERSGIRADGSNGFYYQSFDSAIRKEGDMMRVLDLLNKQVGIIGIFSDWPATVTFYANCVGRK